MKRLFALISRTVYAGAVHAVASQLTLMELAKRTNNGDLITIAEVLNETNEIFLDAPMLEANQATGHVITRRTTLPSGTWRKLNAGVDAEASQTTQLVEAIGMLESYSKVDAKLVKLAPNPVEFRMGEDRAFIEGMSQTVADTLIYGNMGANPERFNGLATRYNEMSLANVWEGSGTGSDLTSIWIVQWGQTMCHLIYPKASSSIGIQAKDLGEDTVQDSNSKEYQAFRTHFSIDVGIAVRDDRCVQRYANCESSGAANIFNDDILIKMLRKLPYQGRGAVIYANDVVLAQMDIRLKDKSNVNYSVSDAFGIPVTMFRAVPVRRVDAILNTESAVT